MMNQNGKLGTRFFLFHCLLAVLFLVPVWGGGSLLADEDIRVEGPIQALGSDSLVVAATVFFVDENTEIRGPEGDVDFAALQPGLVVEVRANLLAKDTFLAERIEFRSDVETEGVIQTLVVDSSGNGHLSVNGIVFQIDSGTEVRGPHGAHLQADDLQPGDFVEVRADLQPDFTYRATRVEQTDPDDPDEFEVSGFIQTVGTDSSILVNNLLFFIDAGTEIRGEHGTILTFSDLQSGDFVEVEAFLRSDGTFLALRIERENVRGEVKVRGVIASLGPDSLVVNGLTFFVDANTRFRDAAGNPLTFDDFQSGDAVEVRAVRRPDLTLLATRVTLRNRLSDEVELTAPIDTLFNDTLVVAGRRFWTNANTEIRDDDNRPIAFADLQIGMIVQIRGLRQPDGSLFATRIKVEDFFQDEVEVRGIIDSVGVDYIAVLGLRFFVDAGTVILNNDNAPIGFADLTAGVPVQVRAERQPDGRLLATRIKVEDFDGNQVELTGQIDFLGENSLRVEGIEFTINENTLVLDQSNNPIPLAELTTGAIVEVRAVRQTEGTLLAVRIKIEDHPGFLTIRGIVHAVLPGAVVVTQPQFDLTTGTVVLDEKFRPVPHNALTTGQEVTLWARVTNGAALALQIKINRGAGLTAISPRDDAENQPRRFELGQNYPNPFNPSTTIPFTLHGSQFQRVRLSIFNILGQEVRILFNGLLDGGNYEFRWDGTNRQGNALASGVYFYQLRVNETVIATRRMLLLK